MFSDSWGEIHRLLYLLHCEESHTEKPLFLFSFYTILHNIHCIRFLIFNISCYCHKTVVILLLKKCLPAFECFFFFLPSSSWGGETGFSCDFRCTYLKSLESCPPCWVQHNHCSLVTNVCSPTGFWVVPGESWLLLGEIGCKQEAAPKTCLWLLWSLDSCTHLRFAHKTLTFKHSLTISQVAKLLKMWRNPETDQVKVAAVL